MSFTSLQYDQVIYGQDNMLLCYVVEGLDTSDNSHLSLLLSRLPELRRASIEHTLVAAQVYQIMPQTDTGALWHDMYLSSNVHMI